MVIKAASRFILLCALLGCVSAGCRRETNLKSSLKELETAFTNTAAPGLAAQTPAIESVPPPAPTPPADANALVRVALTAARADDYANGVIALQEAQQQSGISAEQVMVVQRTKQALMTELQNRAANGDRAALAQLKVIEKTRSQ